MHVLLLVFDVGLHIGVNLITNHKMVDVNVGSLFYITDLISHFLIL
jgi:hypothetical protein